jgi:hypothetical protein
VLVSFWPEKKIRVEMVICLRDAKIKVQTSRAIGMITYSTVVTAEQAMFACVSFREPSTASTESKAIWEEGVGV